MLSIFQLPQKHNRHCLFQVCFSYISVLRIILWLIEIYFKLVNTTNFTHMNCEWYYRHFRTLYNICYRNLPKLISNMTCISCKNKLFSIKQVLRSIPNSNLIIQGLENKKNPTVYKSVDSTSNWTKIDDIRGFHLDIFFWLLITKLTRFLLCMSFDLLESSFLLLILHICLGG